MDFSYPVDITAESATNAFVDNRRASRIGEHCVKSSMSSTFHASRCSSRPSSSRFPSSISGNLVFNSTAPAPVAGAR